MKRDCNLVNLLCNEGRYNKRIRYPLSPPVQDWLASKCDNNAMSFLLPNDGE